MPADIVKKKPKKQEVREFLFSLNTQTQIKFRIKSQ